MPLDDMTREQLARYVDGDMAGDALKAFAHRLKSEPDLRAELIVQRQINQSLRRLFQPSCNKVEQSGSLHLTNGQSAEAVEPVIAGKLEPATRERSAWPRRLAIAAALVLCAGGAWLAWRTLMPGAPTDGVAKDLPPKVRTARDYYQYKVDRDFEPGWKCENDTEFANTFRDRLGQPLLLKPMPAGSRMLGLDYTDVFTPKTISMLAEADGKQIVVLVDRKTADNPERVNADLGNLHAFRIEVGSLVLYEITPLNESRVMEFLYKP